MDTTQHDFSFIEDDSSRVKGCLELEKPLPFENGPQGSGFYRQGRMHLDGAADLELVLYHSAATSRFIYLRKLKADANLLRLVGLSEEEIRATGGLELPGQLCLGPDRVRTIGAAISDLTSAPPLQATIRSKRQENIAIFPIAREGLKYQVADSLFEQNGFYCDEIVLDAHHVFDSSVPVYNRKVELTLFKDKDLDKAQHQNITLAFIADSIASGLVMKEVVLKVHERFSNLERVEIICPLTTIRGLTRVARAELQPGLKIRLHAFETILNALPPDYYYSAHYPDPVLHIRPDLEEAYRAWWGRDNAGNWIADTACAGYGWSEVFFSPRKQIQMINDQLQSRHGLSVADIVRRNIA
jgi:hypothetical protein